MSDRNASAADGRNGVLCAHGFRDTILSISVATDDDAYVSAALTRHAAGTIEIHEALSRFGDDSVGDVLGAFEQINGWMHVPREGLRRVALLIRAPGVREEIQGLSCTVQLITSMAPTLRSLQ